MAKKDNKYLVDSNVWIGFYKSNDALHEQATHTLQQIERLGAQIIISNFIIQEVFTVLSLAANNKKSFKFYDTVTHVKHVYSLDIDKSWLEETTELIRVQKLSSSLSLVDASNLVLCAAFGLELVSFDKQLMAAYKKLSQ